jgi:hypothetical protein
MDGALRRTCRGRETKINRSEAENRKMGFTKKETTDASANEDGPQSICPVYM